MNMFPYYKDMNSYPSQWNHMPATHYYYPSWEAASPHSNEDKSSSSCAHESWPNSYGYPVPMQCHNCCSHGQHPAYYSFRPPCSHVPPPPPSAACHHFYGGYPPYPQPYPMYYFPPPHYSMDLPRYEYDKNVPRDQFHCCGCLNHPCHMKGRNNVKIEEHEPDVDTKKNEPSFPAGANNNFPYPFMWVPPEYTMDKEQPRRLLENEAHQQHDLPNVNKPQVQRIPVQSETKEKDGSPLDRKPNQSVQSAEHDPNSRYGWFPLDINKIKRLMESGDAKQTNEQETKSKDDNNAHDVENKGIDKQASYPIIWVPRDGKANDSSKGQVDRTAGGMASKESPAYNVVPREVEVEHTDNEAKKQRPAAGEDDDSSIGGVGVEKKRRVRTIPVKQLEDTTTKSSNKEEEHKQDAAKKASNVQSSSTNKKSKLPPICLRVDPPKKKNVGGSSRPSSPPGDKKRQDSDESSSERKCKQPHKEVKVKGVEDKTPSQHKDELSHGAEEIEHGSKKLKDQADGVQEKVEKQADVESGDCEMRAQEPLVAKEGEFQQESKQERRVMLETEAAVIIQTAYRGHDVRRSEPIKKLKEIADVHKEAIQLKKHLEDFESRGVIDEKEKTATGETIMKLLLKLDAIQGLHQSIRDVRRSMTKDLIILQEKLDSIVSQKPDHSVSQAVEETSAASVSVEELSKDSDLVEEPSKDSSLVEDPSENCGLVEEPSKDSGLVEESTKDTSLVEEPSEDTSLVEEPFRDSGIVEGSEVTADAGEPIKGSSLDGDKSSNGLSLTQPLPCQDILCGSENMETLEAAVINTESQREPHDDIMVSSAGSEESVAPAGLGLNTEESEAGEAVLEKSTKEFQQSLVDTSSIEDLQNGLGFENNDEGGNLLFELPHEVVEESPATIGATEDIAMQKDLLTGNEDQEENLLSEVPRAGQNDMVTGNEDQEADLLELSGDVEDDEKTIKLTECDWGSSGLASSNEEKPREDAGSASKVERVEEDVDMLFNLPRDVDNEDDKELNQVEISGSLDNDQAMDRPNERLELGNEEAEVVFMKHENHEPTSGQAVESNTSPTDIEIPVTDEGGSKAQESASEEVDEVVEVPVSEEKEDEVTEVGAEMSNAEGSAMTISLLDQKKKSETVEQESVNEEDGSSELSFESRSSVVMGEKDEPTDKKILEENEKLREMLEKLLAAGKEQQEVISNLNGKVKDLEKKLGRKKKAKSAKHPRVRVARPLCGKPTSGSLGERPMGIAS